MSCSIHFIILKCIGLPLPNLTQSQTVTWLQEVRILSHCLPAFFTLGQHHLHATDYAAMFSSASDENVAAGHVPRLMGTYPWGRMWMPVLQLGATD